MSSPSIALRSWVSPSPVCLDGALSSRLHHWLTGSKLPALVLALLLVLASLHPALADPSAPTISRFDAQRGPVGSFVIVTGTELSGATAVTFNNTSALASLQTVSSTRLIVRVPAGATSGPIAVTTPGGTATSSGNFTVTRPKGVVGWGWNSRGQTSMPTELSDVAAIAAGYDFSWALKSDGSLVGWGDNDYGWVNVPPGLTGVAAIDADAYHTMALKSDGTVVIWGDNGVGQCNIPTGLGGVVAVNTGYYHSVALKSDGTVVVWGDNSYGERNVPPGLTDVVAIEAGVLHCLAIKSDGTVVAWGSNERGETNVPAGLSGVVDIAAGEYYSLALKSDGTIVGWGSNDYGVLNIPAGLSGVVAIEAGSYHAVALKSDGTIVAWGMDVAGSLQVPAGLRRASAISAGYLHSLAIVNNIPTNITLSNPSIAENQPSGTAVGTLASTDADTTDSFTYSLVNGEGDTDNASFVLDGATLKTAASFDFETKSGYSIRVQTNDGDGGIYSKALTVTVIDVNETPVITTVSLAAAPTSAGPFVAVAPKTNDTLQAIVSASDPDNNTLTYNYTWTTNGQVSRTFSTPNATDTFNLAIPLNGDKEDLIEVEVTISDGTLTDNSSANTTVANSAPVVKPIVLTTWGGRSVLSRPEVSDDDDEPLAFTYPMNLGSQGGSFSYDSASDGLFLYNPPATVSSATSEVNNFSVSDGNDSASSTITVQLAPVPVGVERYVALGASDVQGYGASDYDYSKISFSPAKSYAPLLVQNDKLGSRFSGIALSRRAVNGFTVADALRQVDGQSLLTQANSDGARAISLWYGPNDVLDGLLPQLVGALAFNPSGSNLNTVADNWLISWRPNYSSVVTKLRRSNPKAVIAAVGTPDLGPVLAPLLAQRLGITNTTVITRIRTAITRASNGINSHINSLNLPYVDVVGNADITTNGVVDNSLVYKTTDLFTDGFHPNDSGYAKLATRLWRLFDPRLNHQPMANSAVKVVTQDTPASGQLFGTDFEGSPLTFAKAAEPAHGSVAVQSNGSYTYTPATGYTGPDSFTFTVNDGTDTSAPATVSLTVRETVAPTIALTSPTINQKIQLSTFSGNVISGTASDNVGVTSVKVRLSRKRNDVNEYWNGSDFIASQVLLSATVTPVGGTNVNWTLDGQLPPAAKLEAGLYAVQVSAQDAAGNKSDYANSTFTLYSDLVVPTLVISTPTANQKVLIPQFSPNTISGTATDDNTVTAIKVRLSRKRGTTNYYWNGTDFVTAASSYVDAQLNGTTWYLGTQTPPAGKLDVGAYQVEAYAQDGAGNKSTTAKVLFTLATDFTVPTVAIITPAQNQQVNINTLSAGALSGTASDDTAVASVKLKLQRNRGGVLYYWNGTAFSTTVALFDATYNSESGTWSYDSAIPASVLDTGGYTLYATAYDIAGNFKTSSSRLFSIIGTATTSNRSAVSAASSPSAGSS